MPQPLSPQDLLTLSKRNLLVKTLKTTTDPNQTTSGSALYQWNKPASTATAIGAGRVLRITPAKADAPVGCGQHTELGTAPCCDS